MARAGQSGVVEPEQNHGHVHQHAADGSDAVQLRTGEFHLSAEHTAQTQVCMSHGQAVTVTQTSQSQSEGLSHIIAHSDRLSPAKT